MRFIRNIFSFIILSVLMFSCTRDKKMYDVQDLSGSLCSCDNGKYIEYHFTEDHVIGFLVLERVFSSKFDFNNNRLTFYKDDGTKSEFRKFSKYSVFPLEECELYGVNLDSIAKKHYDYMFWKRKKWFECKRTKEETSKLDSLDGNFEDFF